MAPGFAFSAGHGAQSPFSGESFIYLVEQASGDGHFLLQYFGAHTQGHFKFLPDT